MPRTDVSSSSNFSFARFFGGGSYFSVGRHLKNSTSRSTMSLAVLVVTLLITACSSDPPKYQWKDGKAAISDYHAYLAELRLVSNTSIESIARDMADWLEMEDSVIACVMRDTTSQKQIHYYPMDELTDEQLRDLAEKLDRLDNQLT